MAVRLRPFGFSDSDYAAMVEIGRRNFPDDVFSARSVREHDALVQKEDRVLYRVVATEGGEFIGHGQLRHIIWSFHSDRYWFFVTVRPDAQGRGVGSALAADLLQEARRLNARELHSATDDDQPAAIGFLEKLGFTERERERQSRLDLITFDPEPFRPYLEQVRASGITITAFADLQEIVPDWLDRFYDLYTDLEADTPWELEYTKPSIEDFRAVTVDSDSFRTEGTFIARDGEDWIGLTELRVSDEGEHPLFQELTGTRAAYRRRGVATALKVRGMAWARSAGFERVGTWNSTRNAPMLAVNEKLGFRKLRETIEYEHRLGL
jgi:RimJ/RimL family protein N-acetyltransferase